MEPVTLTEKEWDEEYQPLQSEIELDDYETVVQVAMALSGGNTQEAYRHVWTVIEGDNDRQWLVNGFHTVNKIGYRTCLIPFSGDENCDITVAYVTDEDYDR